jgi:hypothetical protein
MPILQKSNHLKDKCFWNPNNLDNKLKEKQEVAINEVFAQQPKHGMSKKGKTQLMVLPLITLSFAILVANKVIHQQITFGNKRSSKL